MMTEIVILFIFSQQRLLKDMKIYFSCLLACVLWPNGKRNSLMKKFRHEKRSEIGHHHRQ